MEVREAEENGNKQGLSPQHFVKPALGLCIHVIRRQ